VTAWSSCLPPLVRRHLIPLPFSLPIFFPFPPHAALHPESFAFEFPPQRETPSPLNLAANPPWQTIGSFLFLIAAPMMISQLCTPWCFPLNMSLLLTSVWPLSCSSHQESPSGISGAIELLLIFIRKWPVLYSFPPFFPMAPEAIELSFLLDRSLSSAIPFRSGLSPAPQSFSKTLPPYDTPFFLFHHCMSRSRPVLIQTSPHLLLPHFPFCPSFSHFSIPPEIPVCRAAKPLPFPSIHLLFRLPKITSAGTITRFLIFFRTFIPDHIFLLFLFSRREPLLVFSPPQWALFCCRNGILAIFLFD